MERRAGAVRLDVTRRRGTYGASAGGVSTGPRRRMIGELLELRPPPCERETQGGRAAVAAGTSRPRRRRPAGSAAAQGARPAAWPPFDGRDGRARAGAWHPFGGRAGRGVRPGIAAADADRIVERASSRTTPALLAGTRRRSMIAASGGARRGARDRGGLGVGARRGRGGVRKRFPPRPVPARRGSRLAAGLGPRDRPASSARRSALGRRRHALRAPRHGGRAPIAELAPGRRRRVSGGARRRTGAPEPRQSLGKIRPAGPCWPVPYTVEVRMERRSRQSTGPRPGSASVRPAVRESRDDRRQPPQQPVDRGSFGTSPVSCPGGGAPRRAGNAPPTTSHGRRPVGPPATARPPRTQEPAPPTPPPAPTTCPATAHPATRAKAVPAARRSASGGDDGRRATGSGRGQADAGSRRRRPQREGQAAATTEPGAGHLAP